MIIENSEAIFSRLSAALSPVISEIRSKTLPKTVLFMGKDRESRYGAALLCAASLVCTNKSESVPCLKCNSCRKVLSEHHADVTILSCSGGKVKVDDIRNARRDAYATAFEADCKVFIIDEAQWLGAGSQNALLKILEEPPEHVYFILTSPDAGLLLPTVSSRCTKFSLGTVTFEDVYSTICELRGEKGIQCTQMASAVSYLEGFEINAENIKMLQQALGICNTYFRDGLFPYNMLPTKKEDASILQLTFKLLSLCALEVCRSKKGVPIKKGILSPDSLEAALMKMPMRTAFSRYEFFCDMAERLERNANLGAVISAVRTEL